MPKDLIPAMGFLRVDKKAAHVVTDQKEDTMSDEKTKLEYTRQIKTL